MPTRRVRGDFTQRIVAEQARAQLDMREAIALRAEARDLRVGQPRANRNRVKPLAVFDQLLETAPVARLHFDHLRQLIDRLLVVAQTLRRDLKRVGGIVARDDLAVAILDQPAIRRYRHDRDAVELGLRHVGVVLDDLQPRKARQQRDERSKHEHRRHRDADPKVINLTLRIAHRRGARTKRKFVTRRATTTKQTPGGHGAG